MKQRKLPGTGTVATAYECTVRYLDPRITFWKGKKKNWFRQNNSEKWQVTETPSSAVILRGLSYWGSRL